MTSRNDEANAVSLVDHSVLRRAVAEFAAQPGQQRCYDVLRSCMYGELLLDTTGSSALTGTPFAHGSELRIHGGSGPNGGKALFAFTRNEEIARRHPPGTATQSLVQSAVATLEFARSQGYAWLYIDPAGPTCALSATEIDFALRNPNNETLKKALADFSDGLIDRQAVLQVLRQDGPLLLGADDSVAGKVGIRVLEHDEGFEPARFHQRARGRRLQPRRCGHGADHPPGSRPPPRTRPPRNRHQPRPTPHCILDHRTVRRRPRPRRRCALNHVHIRG